ncbi:MAG: hypothetical protein E6Q32_01770 [Neisseriales bacterium]|jgi:hypothetical protein|nr:MAG: hypothetical protein E6Q32_01770 [Neisseriales bacterium]
MFKGWYWVIIVLILGGVAAFLAYNSGSNEKAVDWQKKYPQLSNNAGYGTLAASVPAYQARTASQQELIGKVSNEFGIRDDVLNLILNTIPESNVRATIAAIKLAQYYQQQIGVTDDKEMNVISNKALAANYCLNLPMLEQHAFINKYADMLRDTPARKAEQNRIENLLSNHVISADYGIQSYDFKEQCDHFLGVNS